MVPIMDRASDPSAKRIVVVTSSQMAKTELALNIAGHRLDDDPTPIIYVGPTKSNIDGVIEPRVQKMLQNTPDLWSRTVKGRAASKLIKRVSGMEFRLGWAGSATEVASMPAGLVMTDERDRMESIKGEGDVVELLEARLATYPDGLSLINSTPTLGTVETYVHEETGLEHWKYADPEDVTSPVWQLWQEGTRHEWAVPCQHCDEYFIPRFKLLNWPEGCTAHKAKQKARLVCPHCGAEHGEESKTQMNAEGLYLAPGQYVEDGEVRGEFEESDTWSFWISGIMSPWVTFGQRAASWLRATESGKQDRIQAVLNTRFGELYATKGEAPPWEDVKACAAEYKTWEIPNWVQRLYLTVDVQKDRLPWVLRGWGPGQSSALIACGEIWGETLKEDSTKLTEVWDKLEDFADKKFGDLSINKVAVDAGYRIDQVCAFCRRQPSRFEPTKSETKNPRRLYWASNLSVNKQGKTVKTGTKLWLVDSNHFKSWVHDRIGWPRDQDGVWLLPSDVTDDYCQQIVAEQKMHLPSGRIQWIQTAKDNHFLDCEMLQAYLADKEGVRNLKHPGESKPKPKKKKPGSDFWGGRDFSNW